MESKLKDYMVAHKFKTEELRDQYFEMSKDMTADDIRANMKNENASFQMNWNNEKNDMVMFCWWKANSPEAIEETLGEMGQMFVNDIKEMANEVDYDLYLVANTDVPWVADTHRQWEDESRDGRRKAFEHRLKGELLARDKEFIEITGDDFEDRFIQARDAIIKHAFKGKTYADFGLKQPS